MTLMMNPSSEENVTNFPPLLLCVEEVLFHETILLTLQLCSALRTAGRKTNVGATLDARKFDLSRINPIRRSPPKPLQCRQVVSVISKPLSFLVDERFNQKNLLRTDCESEAVTYISTNTYI